MNTNVNLIICADEKETPVLHHGRFLSGYENDIFWSTEILVDTNILEKLVFSIARKPKRLIAHLQRIYYCFNKNSTEQLYAAISDFLIILNGRGSAISWRVVLGAKTVLTEDQSIILSNYLKNNKNNSISLSGNQYSIFSKGLRGLNNLIQQANQAPEFSYDPLELARDHIEYSQLDQAKRVLEKATLEDPARFELQHELLDLYQLTQDSIGFNQMLTQLAQSGISITDEWMRLSNYFKGRDSNG